MCREYFPGFAGRLDDPRVRVHHQDGREFVRSCDWTYDVVLVDISDPQDPADSIFTTEFYEELMAVMAPSAVMHTHYESPDSSRGMFYRTIATPEASFDVVRPYRHWVPADIDFWGRAVATDGPDPLSLSVADVADRLEARGVDTEWLSPELCHSMFRSLNRQVLEALNEDWEPINEDRSVNFERPSGCAVCQQVPRR